MSRTAELVLSGMTGIFPINGRCPEGSFVETFIDNRKRDINHPTNLLEGRIQDDPCEHERFGCPDDIDQYIISRNKQIDY